jgi:uncharacterized membrane protein
LISLSLNLEKPPNPRSRFSEAVDAPAPQVWNSWRELETQERAQGEYVI